MRKDTVNAPCSGAPTSATDVAHLEDACTVFKHTLGSCSRSGSLTSISTIFLGKQLICAKWIQHVLNDDHEYAAVHHLFPVLAEWGDIFLDCILMLVYFSLRTINIFKIIA